MDIDIPEPQRVPAPCPYFGGCGGCSLQHSSPDFYRAFKLNLVQEPLARTGIAVEAFENPVFLPPTTRRRTTIAALKTKGGVILGYNEMRSHKIIDVRHCLILEPELEQTVQALRPYLSRLLPEAKPCDITLQRIDGAYDMVLTGPFKFGTYQQDEALGELAADLDIARISHRTQDFRPLEVILKRKSVLKKFGAITVEVPPAAFLQASAAGERALCEIVSSYAGDARNIVDLFAGCGTFSGALTQDGRQITAYDGDAPAIGALAKALPAQRRDLFKDPLRANELSAFDCAVFDPPRAGAKEQARELAASSIPKIIGVSCNPATFARDAKILQVGGYHLKSVTLVDQFVWSTHVEVVGLFLKNL